MTDLRYLLAIYAHAHQTGNSVPPHIDAEARAALAQPEPDISQTSDGYHTFAELYEHRHALCLALMRSMPGHWWFSRRHADGELCFGGDEWFIIGADLPGLDDSSVTYHLPMRLWDAARATGVQELTKGRPWDGHSAQDVVDRFMLWASLAQPKPVGNRVAELETELERERLRLVACGVVAMADTPESAARARDMHPDYRSDSLDDVIRQIDALMELRSRLAQPEPEGPTDEEVISAAAKAGFAYECAGGLFNSYIDSADIKPDVLSFARDLLARWGNSAKPEPQGALEEHYEWELEDASGEWVAGGSANDQEAVHQEGMRYLSAYSQDGPHKLTIRRHQVHTVLQASASVTDELPLD